MCLFIVANFFNHRVFNNRVEDRLPKRKSFFVRYCLTAVLPLLLGLMVLAWGTGYKLSLYHAQAKIDSAPTAKLCTRSSDVARSGVEAALIPAVPTQAMLLLSLLPVAQPDSRFSELRAGEAKLSKPSPPPFSSNLYLRPPPSSVFMPV